MKYGIDKKGKKICYKDALKNEIYLCPFCTEKLILRNGRKSCFAHNIIKKRTPLQRTCPEYHENDKYRKIDNLVDIIYIENGGIPLYLCNDGNKFEIRAYFPSLSETCMNSLIKNNTEIIINNKIWCYIENLNYYNVYNIKDWIDVKINPSISFNEIKRKWLWGIRGINIEKDIYHSNNEGGYRVAIKSNIYVGKKYRMLFLKDQIPFINGIAFRCIGEIKLRKGINEVLFSVCDIEIKEYNEDARQFIESKGYHLRKNINKVIPLWPPIIFKGNELITDSDKVWFFHENGSNNEYINEINDGEICKTIRRNIFKIYNISSINEKAIVVSDESIENVSSEIKYVFKYEKKLENDKYIKPEIIIKDIDGNIISFDNNILPSKRKVFIHSNIPSCLMLINDNYCLSSSEYFLEGLDYNNEIVIDCKGFGRICWKYKRKSEKVSEINWSFLYSKLYLSSGKLINPKYNCKIVLYKIKKNLNKNNIKVYLILCEWLRKGEIPIDAQQIIDRNERMILSND